MVWASGGAADFPKALGEAHIRIRRLPAVGGVVPSPPSDTELNPHAGTR